MKAKIGATHLYQRKKKSTFYDTYRYRSLQLLQKRYEFFEAIVDTGATFCAIAKHIAKEVRILLEAGFEYVLQKDGLAYFRKRK